MISDGRSSASPTSPPYSDYHHPAHAESYQQAYQAQTQHKNPHHHTPPSSPSYANSAAQCCSLRRCCAPPQPSSHPPASRQRHRRWHGTWCCCCYCPSHAANSIFTSLGVCILVLGYTLLGAFTFMALEGEGFSKETLISANHVVTSSTSASSSATSFKSGDVGLGRDKSIALGEDIRSRTVEKLWSITEDLNILYKDNWTRLAAQEVLKFQDSLVRNLRGYGGGGAVIVKTGIAGSGNGGAIYYNHHHRWSFASSFLYSLTLITTIEYWDLYELETGLREQVAPSRDLTLCVLLPPLESGEAISPLLTHLLEEVSALHGATIVLTLPSAFSPQNPTNASGNSIPDVRGYGSVAPRTQWGKVITIVYALIGIPLMLVYLSTVGDVLARSFRRMYGRLCGHSGTSSGCNGRSSKNASGKAKLASTGISATTESYLSTGYTPSIIKSHNSISSDGSAVKVHHYPQNITGDVVGDDVAKIDRVGSGLMIDCGGDGIVASSASSSTAMNPNNKHHHHHFRQNEESYCSETVRVPISLCLLIILLYICAGAFLFNRLENWTFLEGSYFCFTSLGTIGFGDLIPGLYHSYQMQYQSSPSISSTAEQISVFASSTYILFGMALIAMCFNLVQDEVVIIVRRLGQFFGVCTSHGSGISKGNADDEDMVIDGVDGEGIAMAVVSSSATSS